ncbi:MAG: hypothetical protein OXD43_05905 [Bacteroidetes bacterium]|nr:hypothetical protein [Bacteroidota bacterium]
MDNSLYLGLDAPRSQLCSGHNGSVGVCGLYQRVITSERALIEHVTRISERSKYLVVEESTLSGWIAGVLRPHVTPVSFMRYRGISACKRAHERLSVKWGGRAVIQAVRLRDRPEIPLHLIAHGLPPHTPVLLPQHVPDRPPKSVLWIVFPIMCPPPSVYDRM